MHIKNGAITGKDNVGGILGQGTGIISFSSNGAEINGAYQVGGIIGKTTNNILFACYNTGNIAGRQFMGGLLGLADAKITASYNTGSVTSNTEMNVSGLACNAGSNPGIIACYNTGKLTPKNGSASLAIFGSVILTACYWKVGSAEMGAAALLVLSNSLHRTLMIAPSGAQETAQVAALTGKTALCCPSCGTRNKRSPDLLN